MNNGTLLRPETAKTGAIIRARGLGKSYGRTQAVQELHLEVGEGEFFGLLGPNGSGKTTTIHMLTTLVRATAGHGEVAGHDVVRAGVAVRREIGLVFQESASDPNLTVNEMLHFAGTLRSLSNKVIRERSDELLELFELQEKRLHRISTLSGGMRRGLDIAQTLLHRPRILFLDEPTLGLDVPSRRKIWHYIAQLRRDHGTTVFLTTHYLEEAEDCDQIAFLANGWIVGSGVPKDLVQRMGPRMIEIEGDDLDSAVTHLTQRCGPCLRENGRVTFRVERDDISIVDNLSHDDGVTSVRRRRPNLNDVFLWITHPELGQGILQ